MNVLGNTVLFAGASEIKQDIIDKMDESNGIDYLMVNKFIGNVKPAIEWIAGYMLALTSIMLLLIICLEIAYLVTPGFKQLIDKRVLDTDGIAKRPMELILHDAINSYREFVTHDGESNVLLIYLVRKSKVILIYGICFAIATGYALPIIKVIYKNVKIIVDSVMGSLT